MLTLSVDLLLRNVISSSCVPDLARTRSSAEVQLFNRSLTWTFDNVRRTCSFKALQAGVSDCCYSSARACYCAVAVSYVQLCWSSKDHTKCSCGVLLVWGSEECSRLRRAGEIVIALFIPTVQLCKCFCVMQSQPCVTYASLSYWRHVCTFVVNKTKMVTRICIVRLVSFFL
jgi:hypothetical protein